MIVKKVISILAIAALSACGGSSNKATTPDPAPTPPPANTAPTANNDVGLAQNNQPVVIDVLSNDTDAENNEITISKVVTMPTMGSVEISNNTLVYTPNKDVALKDSLEYEISDGELTATATVEITVNHTLNIHGKVTDSPIANAEVTTLLGNELFTATADNEGNYTLALTINSMVPELVVIAAKGSEDKAQQGVELIAIINDTTSLLSQVNDNRDIVTDDNSTNVTHVTTASYLLTADRNSNKAVTSMAEFKQLASELDSSELMSTAGFIKLLVDNDDFDIPNDETTLSLLSENNNEAVSTFDAINSYLTENDLLDDNGQPTTEYTEALSVAINETVNDPDVVEQFTAEMFTSKTMIKLPAIKEGWLPYSGDAFVFSDNDYTVFYDANSFADNPEIVYTRSIVDGKLRLKTNEYRRDYITIHSSVFDLLVEQFGFSQSLEDELVMALAEGKLANGVNVDIMIYDEYIDYTLISSNDINYQVAIETKSYYQFDMPTGIDWSVDVAKSEIFTNKSNGSLIHTPEKLWKNKLLNELSGNWLFYFDGNFKNYLKNFEQSTAPFATITALSPSSASAIADEKEYSTSLTGGVLSLTNGNENYRIKPIQSSSNAYLAIVEKWLNGKLEYAHARQIAKLESDFSTFSDALATELPKVQLVYLDGYLSDAWQGEKLKLDYIYGHQFSESGDLMRGLIGESASNNFHDYGVDHFDLGDTRWKWNKNDGLINLTLNLESFMAHRTWQVISTNENGYTMLLEQSIRGFDKNDNGVIEDSEIGQYIRPRVQIIKQDDLSRWQEAWQNTKDLSLVPKNNNHNTQFSSAKKQNIN